MQIVDPNAPKVSKRKKKEPIPTPEQYAGYYSHLGCSPEGGSYYVRAKDKGGVFAKRIKESINRRDERNGTNPELRVIAFSQGGHGGSYGFNRHTFGAAWMTDEQAMNLPAKAQISKEQDLRNLITRAQEIADENTMKNFIERLQMGLGMLFGEIRVEDKVGWQRRTQRTLSMKGFRVTVDLDQEREI